MLYNGDRYVALVRNDRSKISLARFVWNMLEAARSHTHVVVAMDAHPVVLRVVDVFSD